MSVCSLNYIPKRLHFTDERVYIETFNLSDVLYRRVPQSALENPFGSISLTDLSHNIGITNKIEVSKEKDVLYSILEEEVVEIYDQEVIALEVISLNEENKYDKTFHCPKREELKVRALLAHDPIPCMYPHAVICFFIYRNENEVEVTMENYRKTLGHNSYKHLRTKLRHELTKMIVRKEISYRN